MSYEDLNFKVESGITARNGEMIHICDWVETVQGTKFKVVMHGSICCLQDEGGNLWNFEPYMSPNLWIL